MKIKNLLVIGLLLQIPYLSYSQSDSLLNKPSKNDLMIEINFNPFSDSIVFSLDDLQIKYWINDQIVVRLGTNFEYKNKTQTIEDNKKYEKYPTTYSKQSFYLEFRPGMEYRIFTKTPISPYFGFDFSYKNRWSKSEYKEEIRNTQNKYVENNVIIEGAWREYYYDYYDYYYRGISYSKERAFSSYGLNLLFGTDFNIYKNTYIGFEIGGQFDYKINKQIKVISITENLSFPPYEPIKENTTYPSNKEMNFGFTSNKSIRLGIYF